MHLNQLDVVELLQVLVVQSKENAANLMRLLVNLPYISFEKTQQKCDPCYYVLSMLCIFECASHDEKHAADRKQSRLHVGEVEF